MGKHRKKKEIDVVEQPSLCHRMVFDTERIAGECDGIEAVKQAIWFIDWGKEYKEPENSPKLMDWEQDENMIISAVDKNIKGAETCLDLPFLHWWTFLNKFAERGECQLSFVTDIRDKLAKGKNLEKYEKEILRENRDIIILKDKNNEDFENELWGD